MNWGDQIIRLRRFLRDPRGNIWSDALILRLFNECQREIQQKTRVLEDVQSVQIPPLFAMSYLQDFESAFPYGKFEPTYQAFHYYQESEYVISSPFEGQILSDFDEDFTEESGMHFTHPWEGFVATPADIIPLRLPEGFYEAVMVAWDDGPIDYLTQKEISQNDPTWKTRQGEPYGYWRPDVTEPYFCLFPQPSAPVWDDDAPDDPEESEYACSQEWENSTTYFSTNGSQFARDDSDQELTISYDWEYLNYRGDTLADDSLIIGQHTWEGQHASILVIVEDGSIWKTGDGPLSPDVYTADYEISTSAIDSADNALFIYRIEPTEIKTVTDTGLFPDFLKKYTEYATLERAYAVDCDGQIESLRDYWGQRKNIGIEAIKRYMSKKRVDRDYRLSTQGIPGFKTPVRLPRLPDEYPATP